MDVAQRLAAIGVYVAGRLPTGTTIGMGTGSTTDAVLRAIGERCATDPTFSITGVATSIATRDLAISLGIPVRDLDDVESLDLGYDGADEIDPELNVVKGRGGALLYEKLVAEICTDYWIVAAEDKLVDHLGTRLPLPIEIIPYGWHHTANRLKLVGLVPTLREVGGIPYRSDAGNYILDCTRGAGDLDLLAIAPAIKATTGVVEHGLFPSLAQRAIVIAKDGQIRELTNRS